MKLYKRYETKIKSIKRTKDLLFYIINDKYLTSNLKGAKINDSILFVYGFDSDTYIAILAVKDSSEKGDIKLWLDQD